MVAGAAGSLHGQDKFIARWALNTETVDFTLAIFKTNRSQKCWKDPVDDWQWNDQDGEGLSPSATALQGSCDDSVTRLAQKALHDSLISLFAARHAAR